MLTLYRTVFLATIIASARKAFADILIQPEHLYGQPSQQPVYDATYRQQETAPVEQYDSEQLTQLYLDPQLTQQFTAYQDLYADHYQPRNHLLGWHRPLYRPHLLPYPKLIPHRRLHLAKLGGLGYLGPSTFVGYPRTPAHNRCKRSADDRIDSQITAGAERSIVEDDDVATKPSLDTLRMIVDSAGNQDIEFSEDFSDKYVGIRQSKNDHSIVGTKLLDADSDRTYPGYHEFRNNYEPRYLPRINAEEAKSAESSGKLSQINSLDSSHLSRKPEPSLMDSKDFQHSLLMQGMASQSPISNTRDGTKDCLKPEEKARSDKEERFFHDASRVDAIENQKYTGELPQFSNLNPSVSHSMQRNFPDPRPLHLSKSEAAELYNRRGHHKQSDKELSQNTNGRSSYDSSNWDEMTGTFHSGKKHKLKPGTSYDDSTYNKISPTGCTQLYIFPCIGQNSPYVAPTNPTTYTIYRNNGEYPNSNPGNIYQIGRASNYQHNTKYLILPQKYGNYDVDYRSSYTSPTSYGSAFSTDYIRNYVPPVTYRSIYALPA